MSPMHTKPTRFLAPRPLTQSDASCMAGIHKLCFPNAWTAETFSNYFDKPEWDGVFGFAVEQELPEHNSRTHNSSAHNSTTQSPSAPPLAGFVLGRTVYNTNDILTFAVAPLYQGKGLGRLLLTTYLDAISCGCLLEVATGNTAAIHLYSTFGFEIIASRREYYDSPDPAMRDAYVMGRKTKVYEPSLISNKES